MYNFIDVTEVSEGVVLPSEALKINGEYIENLISGYKTLNVSGREALSPDVESHTTGVRDGSKLKGKRYPERIIVITYQLKAASNEDFRTAYNQLAKILDVEEAELIFNDEQDKFYTGTPCAIGEVSPGTNAVVGKFEIVCTDPFKYSVIEYEATNAPGENTIYVEYGGTYKSYPKLEADFYSETEVADDGETASALTGAGDCGYVAFFNEDEKIIQLGDPEEMDLEEGYAKSQTLMNQTFLSETAWGTTAKKLWAVNNGPVMATNVQPMGSVGMGFSTKTLNSYAGVTSGAFATCMPHIISYSTKNRKANSVTVVVTVTVTMAKGSVATATVTINGKSYSMSMGQLSAKTTGAMARYSSSVSAVVSGLNASDTSIGGNSFAIRITSPTSGTTSASAPGNNIAISPYSTTASWSNYYLAVADYGTATGAWHGPSITRTLSADAAGEVGASEFTLTYKQKMCIAEGASDQVGSFRMNITDASGANIAGIWVYKNKSGKTGNLVFYVNGSKVNETPIDLHYNNTYFGLSEDAVQTSTVSKSGNTISFAVGSYKRQFKNDALADVKAVKVTFSFEKYSALEAMAYNGLYWAKFVKHNCSTYKNIPNKFSANDVLVADCKNAEIYLNGIQSPDLGALGNDWEAFSLRPGLNQIGFSYSDWVTSEYAPTLKILFREVFL